MYQISNFTDNGRFMLPLPLQKLGKYRSALREFILLTQNA